MVPFQIWLTEDRSRGKVPITKEKVDMEDAQREDEA